MPLLLVRVPATTLPSPLDQPYLDSLSLPAASPRPVPPLLWESHDQPSNSFSTSYPKSQSMLPLDLVPSSNIVVVEIPWVNDSVYTNLWLPPPDSHLSAHFRS